MPDLLHQIETRLNATPLGEQLTPLFCETLLWGRPQGGRFNRRVKLTGREQVTLAFAPVAQLGGVPVFRVDWPFDKLPGITHRREVQRSLIETYHDHLLAYVTGDSRQAALVWARRRGEKIQMRALPYAAHSPARTTIEQLGEMAFRPEDLGLSGDPGATAVTDRLNAAFDVEAVGNRFYDAYEAVFKDARRQIGGLGGEALHLFTQKLFNRLMFVVFLERKGWLRFGGSRDYLRALWQAHKREHNTNAEANFYRDRLLPLFFFGLNTKTEADLMAINSGGWLQERIGQVPYLNGGLFEEGDDDRDPAVTVPDAAIEPAMERLFYCFNYTVTESTPLDVEVAVDPEMLGRIFERLITGRHETGSYYTPKPVVAFMGREALKGYLETACPIERPPALALFVDERSPAELRDPEAVLDALKEVKLCDPACGSGAYLVGLLHELLELRACLFSTSGLDPVTAYDRKLEIIQNSLYGVDLDPFAVNIARLRLWLSLIVDYEGDCPPPLPNLDFKIEAGDSLIAPAPAGELQGAFRSGLVDQFRQLKAEYLRAHGSEKVELRQQIGELHTQIASWAGRPEGTPGFDWAVEFAEVFTPPEPLTTLRGSVTELANHVSGQIGLVARSLEGGFDIVLANPPYVRADAQYKHLHDEEDRQAAIERWKEYRQGLKYSRIYRTLHEKWDLYIPFLERAYQLLRHGGCMVFIISDAYNKAKYARKSHDFFLKESRVLRLDFCSDIPIFTAGVTNTILHVVKTSPNEKHIPLRFRRRGNSPDDFDEDVEALSLMPQIASGQALFRPDDSKPVDDYKAFVPLTNICYISYGLRANADDRYWKGEFVTEDLVSVVEDKEHPRPFIEGKDIVPWGVQRIRYLEWGTDRAPYKFARPTFPQLHAAREKLIALVVVAGCSPVMYDDRQLTTTHTSCIFVPWHHLEGVVNRSIDKTAKYRWQSPEGDREEREEVSRQFHPKYLLAIMNSTFACDWLTGQRRSRRHIYPDDWKQLPVAPISLKEQSEFVQMVNVIMAQFEKYGYPLPAQVAARVAVVEREIDERVAALYGL